MLPPSERYDHPNARDRGSLRASAPAAAVATPGHSNTHNRGRLRLTHSDPHECCGEPCDHCRPDIWHDCALPNGHGGFHSCEAS